MKIRTGRKNIVKLPEVESRMSVSTSEDTADGSLPVSGGSDEVMAMLASTVENYFGGLLT